MAVPTGRNFASCYMELCKQQRLRPLPVICVGLPYSLEFTTDRIKMDDWGPILNSLSLDRSLRAISVHSRYQCRKPLEEANSEDKARAMGKAPVVLTRYLLEWLSQSVGQCVRNSYSLTHLELDGIPFPPDCIAVLCVGLSGTESLHHLSLRRCCIGDNGCELICRAIADVRSVSFLNLSHCDLTSGCGGALAAALSRQKLALYHDTWKQSLRYREPDLETMPGLRRLTLNDNPHLGNGAVRQIIEAIRDSLWMKALDLQRCGLTDHLGADLLNLLDQNNTLAVLDVRKNVNLDEELAAEVMRRLDENNAEGKSEYKWMGLAPRDQRTASVGVRKGPGENEEAARLSRSRSAFVGYARRPRQVIAARRTVVPSVVSPPAAPPSSRIKFRPSSPPVRDSATVVQQPRNSRPRPRSTAVIHDVRSVPKVTLHLDLQSRVQPAASQQAAAADRDGAAHRPEREKLVDARCSDHRVASSLVASCSSSSSIPTPTPSPSSSSVKATDAVPLPLQSTLVDPDKIQSILDQLSEAHAERERLLGEAKRADQLLVDERARREVAEMKLRSAQVNVTELENALKTKENEANDYMLVSQQSLDEICLSFDRLLEMLENVTVNHPSGAIRDSHEVASADIKRRLAHVIGQTKSENLKRRYKMNVELPNGVDNARKYVKSESDVRSILPIPIAHLEKKIGEGPASEQPRHQQHRGAAAAAAAAADKALSPGERARAIFASIVSGTVVLDFC